MKQSPLLRARRSSDESAWTLIGIVALLVAISEWRRPLSIAPASLQAAICACLALGATAWFYTGRDRRVTVMCLSATHIVLFTALGSILSYLEARQGGALWDETFIAWDRALGFDGLAYLHWVDERPLVAAALSFAYNSMLPQLALLVLALGFIKKLELLRTVMLAAIISGTVTIILSPCLPATTISNHLGLDANKDAWIGDLVALRAGSMTMIDLTTLQGIIAFPSYHAGLATVMLFGFAFSGLPLFRSVGTVIATLTIASAPVDGGHYLVDVIAGCAIGALSMLTAQKTIYWRPVTFALKAGALRLPMQFSGPMQKKPTTWM